MATGSRMDSHRFAFQLPCVAGSEQGHSPSRKCDSPPPFRKCAAAAAALGVFLSGSCFLDLHHASASVLSENTLLRRYVVTSGESLLRYALPLDENSQEIRRLQSNLEKLEIDFRSKGPTALRGIKRDLEKAQDSLSPGKQADIVVNVSKAHRAEAIAETREAAKDLQALSSQLDTEMAKSKKGRFNRFALDPFRRSALSHVLAVETLMAPEKLPYRIPPRFDNLPRLTGRARVQLELAKADGQSFMDAKGKPMDRVTVEAIVDGYSAPLSSGNFVDLVQRGHYHRTKVTRRERNQLLTIGTGKGFFQNGQRREIPLEVRIDGSLAPLWGSAAEKLDAAEIYPVLPTTAFGAIALTHSDDSVNDASDQLCIFLPDPRSETARSRHGGIENGNISNFGYVVKNEEYLLQLAEGDEIVSAKVISGADRLVPSQS